MTYDVTFPKHVRPLPPGYRVVQLDSGHFMWVGPVDPKLGREAEGAISVYKWDVWRGAFAHANGYQKREQPILFSAPMIRALLAGTKTQTRRLLHEKFSLLMSGSKPGHPGLAACPYGGPGDRLWVRETFGATQLTLDDKHLPGIHYRATDDWPQRGPWPWRPSIFMPRWASRITLEVTGVRVERLQDISEADAVAEGLERDDDWDPERTAWHWPGSESRFESPRACYWAGWDTINAKRAPASSNPWTWVVEFERV